MRTSRLVAVVLALAAGAAWACPVCGLPSEQGQGAYIAMTAVMSLLPLALLGGAVAWVVLRVKRADEAEAREAASAPESPPRT